MLHYLSIKRDLDLGLVVALPFRNKVLQRSWVEICVQSGRPPAIAANHFIKQLKLAFSGQRHSTAQS
jgi:hypothetical protein